MDVDEESEEEGEVKEPKGKEKGVASDMEKEEHSNSQEIHDKDLEVSEWLRRYKKGLILPSGGLPDDLLAGVFRVVDGKQYKLDKHINQDVEKLTPPKTNIYHTGNCDPSYLLPLPFRNLNYGTPFGKTILETLAKDPFDGLGMFLG
jgi:hypothetical protein